MRFLEFKQQIDDLPAFNLNDIRKIDPGFYKPQLTYWQEKGWVKPIAGGYYAFGNVQVNQNLLYFIANKIIQPSYISLESALAYYQIIPERVYGVTSVTSKKTSQFESDWGIFSYRSVKPNLMFGYKVLRSNPGEVVLMASLEKAILDYLYLNSHIDSLEDFEGLRWDQEALVGLRHNAIFDSMLLRFGKKALNHRANQLMRHLDA